MTDRSNAYQRSRLINSKHRTELYDSQWSGCYYCCHIFDPREIQEWIDHDQTALCPYCSVDSVVGDASGIEITLDFLREAHFFGFCYGTNSKGKEWIDEQWVEQNKEWVQTNPCVRAFLDEKGFSR